MSACPPHVRGTYEVGLVVVRNEGACKPDLSGCKAVVHALHRDDRTLAFNPGEEPWAHMEDWLPVRDLPEHERKRLGYT